MAASTFRIRPAQPADASQMNDIHIQSWRHAYAGIVPQAYLDGLEREWTGFFEENLRTGQVKADLLLHGNKPVGCIAYGPARETDIKHRAEIFSLYLLPSYMGQGCGHLLLSHALRLLRRGGAQGCCLHTLSQNTRAQAFYEDHGFRRAGTPQVIVIGGKKLETDQYLLSFAADTQKDL